MKKTLAMLLSVAMVFSLAVVGSPARAEAAIGDSSADKITDEPVTIDLVATFPAGNVNYVGATIIADKMGEMTDGNINFNFLGGTEIFAGPQAAEAVMSGALDAAFMGADYFTGYVPEIAAINASNMTYEEMLESGGLDYLNTIFSENGARILYVVDEVGIQGTVIYTKEPVSQISDLKGKTIRTSGTVQDNILNELGCTTMPLGLGEIFTGLEQGLIDGYCGPAFLGGAMGFFEYCKCMIDTEIARGGTSLLINEDVWQGMSEAQQKLLMDSLLALNEDEVTLFSEYVENNKTMLEEADGIIVELSDKEKEELAEIATKAAWKAVEDTCEADVYEQLHSKFQK